MKLDTYIYLTTKLKMFLDTVFT